MEHYVVYHSTRRMGRPYGSAQGLNFFSSKVGLLRKAIGNTVWIVEGIPDGAKTNYVLHGAYIAETVDSLKGTDGLYAIRGTKGTKVSPPQPLNRHSWFPALLKSQSNFSLGFNRLNSPELVRALTALLPRTAPPKRTEVPEDIDLLLAGKEGRVRLLTHLVRERNRALVDAKKKAVLASTGRLACEVCGFEFGTTYGALGEGFCEVHHLAPLAESDEGTATTLAGLAVLCSNCHRVIHRSDPMLTPFAMAALLRR
jgi:hypothetical protein